MGKNGFSDTKRLLEYLVFLDCCLRGSKMAVGRVGKISGYKLLIMLLVLDSKARSRAYYQICGDGYPIRRQGTSRPQQSPW